MNTQEAIAFRIIQLCKEKGLTPNGISNIAAVPQSTVKSILNGESKNPGAVTIKKLCDGFEITLGEFFSLRSLIVWNRKSNRAYAQKRTVRLGNGALFQFSRFSISAAFSSLRMPCSFRSLMRFVRSDAALSPRVSVSGSPPFSVRAAMLSRSVRS